MLPGMANILVLGSGLAGLTTGMLLARDGHRVTVLERDPDAPPPPDHAEEAWDGWQRKGVNQFRLPHLMLPRWWALVREELPEARPALSAAGARHLNTLAVLPEARRGPLRCRRVSSRVRDRRGRSAAPRSHAGAGCRARRSPR